MINCIQIERVILPPLFIFDSLTLSAKFVSTSVNLTALKFKTHEYLKQRNENINVQLKLPSSRSHFSLILQIHIVNMRIEPVSIPVDLSLFDDTNQLELVFETEVGRVCVFVNIIEEIYLPKQQVNVNKSLSNSGSSNNQIGSQEALQSSIESYRQYNKNSVNESIDQGQKNINNDQKEKTLSKRNYSSKLKGAKKNENMSLSRSEYMKIEVEENLLASDQGNAQTESEIKPTKIQTNQL